MHVPFCEMNPKLSQNKLSVQNGRIGKKLSAETRKKISDKAFAKIKQGTWHNSFSRSRTHEYNGIKFYGRWELAYAKFLDINGKKWRRPDEKFQYEFEGKMRNYTPDFFVEDENAFIEIKGYPTAKDIAKWNAFPHKLRVIFGKELYELGLIDSYRDVKFNIEHEWE